MRDHGSALGWIACAFVVFQFEVAGWLGWLVGRVVGRVQEVGLVPMTWKERAVFIPPLSCLKSYECVVLLLTCK